MLIGGFDSGVQCCHLLLLLLSTPIVTGVIDMATERGQRLIVDSKENTKFVFKNTFRLFVQIMLLGAFNVSSIASLKAVKVVVDVGVFAAVASAFHHRSEYMFCASSYEFHSKAL